MRVLLLTLFLSLHPLAAQERRPLTVEDGDRWRSITAAQLSRAGTWASYGLSIADGSDGSLAVVETAGERRHVIERGHEAAFDAGERFLVCRLRPAKEAVKAHAKAKKDTPKTAGPEPRPALLILDLATGVREEVARVRSFAVPPDAGGWLVIHMLEPEKGEEDKKSPAPPKEAPAEDQDKKGKKKKDRKPGTDLVLRDLTGGGGRTFPNVTQYRLADDGSALVFVTRTSSGEGDGVHRLDLAGGGAPTSVLETLGDVRSLTFSDAGAQLAFLVGEDDDDDEDTPRRWSLVHARGAAAGQVLVSEGTAGLPPGWGVSANLGPRFSESGGRLFLGSAPLPEPKPEEVDEDDRVVLDVWSWTDDRIQPMQLVQRQRDLDRSYLAVVHLDATPARLVQLATPEVPDVRLGDGDETALALGSSELPYRSMRQWDSDVPRDLYRVDVATGERALLVERAQGRAALSPTGRWATWFDGRVRQVLGVDLMAPATPRPLTAGIPHPLHNELHDAPSLPRSYGTGGWLTGDEGLLVYDRYDVWLVDPTDAGSAVCVTEGAGRREGWQLRRVDLDLEEPAVSPMEPLLLSAFHLHDKRAGFFRDRLIGGGEPTPLHVDAKRFSTPVRAEEGTVLRFTRQDYEEAPDLWVADLDLANLRRLSDSNPQQAEFRWGAARLVDWRSADGTPLQGILYTPDDFDPARKYPLLVYFYERMSDQLHVYNAPVPSRSRIRFSYYTSNDYCIFVPDIPYKIGYPGPSCCDAVLPGVLALIDEGFVDEAAIGVQGHSWGGYQIAYMVTRSNLFAAAVAGAPVSNMTSAYGGIRWSSGMSRQFQYERTQSRLGGSLWEVPNRYFENSPVFFADKVQTPLLMLHNDEDGAVPWYQGIEYFVALKRLDKPVWLLNYNGEGHGIGRYAHKRDYAVRMSQFFDHYLRGAPAPRWMVEGVPAVRKGLDLGLDLLEPGEEE